MTIDYIYEQYHQVHLSFIAQDDNLKQNKQIAFN